MADGFKIAEAYVDINARMDGRAIKRAIEQGLREAGLRQAGNEAGREIGEGIEEAIGNKVDEAGRKMSSNFGKQIENWQGVDVGINARLANGVTIQAGTSTGRRLQDNCDVRAKVPETYSWAQTIVTQSARVTNLALPARDGGLQSPYCRVVEPLLTSFRGLGTYLVPKVDIQISATWRSDPGEELRADYVVTNAVAALTAGVTIWPSAAMTKMRTMRLRALVPQTVGMTKQAAACSA